MQLHTKPTQTHVPNKNGFFASTISIFVVPLIKNYSDLNYLFKKKTLPDEEKILPFVHLLSTSMYTDARFLKEVQSSVHAQYSIMVQSSMSCDFFLSWWAIQIGFNCLHKPFNSSTYSISRKRHTKIVR